MHKLGVTQVEERFYRDSLSLAVPSKTVGGNLVTFEFNIWQKGCPAELGNSRDPLNTPGKIWVFCKSKTF